MNGLEPLRLAACEFESHVSTNSTTSPIVDIIHRMNKGIYKKDYDFKLPDDLIAKEYPSKKEDNLVCLESIMSRNTMKISPICFHFSNLTICLYLMKQKFLKLD